MKKLRVYLGDLSYFNEFADSMITAPLNIGYVASYTKKVHENECEIILFKNPDKLLKASKTKPPDVLGLSNYFWNMRLNIGMSEIMKKMNPDCTIVVGGPSICTDMVELSKLNSLYKGMADFFVENEGELGFANVISALLSRGRGKLFNDPIDGCTFFTEAKEPVSGENIGLSLDLSTVPSPILSGLLDEFLNEKYMPIISASRMCPYSCTFCCSGKLRGKIRMFPESVIISELKYVAEKYREYPHRVLFITDENFGVNKRDPVIAKYIHDCSKEYGYPKSIWICFDKRFSKEVRESNLLLRDTLGDHFMLPFQTFNEDSLKAIKRKNMKESELSEAVDWANKNSMKLSSEMIFGFPHETKKSFLDALERSIELRISGNTPHNLFLLQGMVLNRQSERERFGLVTKHRKSFSNACGMLDGKFVCESEEVVVSSDHFSFEDFMDVRKVALMFYMINALGYYEKVFDYLVDRGQKIIPILDLIMSPTIKESAAQEHLSYLNDFIDEVKSELNDTYEELYEKTKEEFLNNRETPARLNPRYAIRLIYGESNWFGETLLKILNESNIPEQDMRVISELMAISENEWVDLKNPGKSRNVIVSEDTLKYLQLQLPKNANPRYNLRMSASKEQIENIVKYNKQFDLKNEIYLYTALYVIWPRKHLRFEMLNPKPCSK